MYILTSHYLAMAHASASAMQGRLPHTLNVHPSRAGSNLLVNADAKPAGELHRLQVCISSHPVPLPQNTYLAACQFGHAKAWLSL